MSCTDYVGVSYSAQTGIEPLRRFTHARGMVLLLFFCSGATALVYEVVWSKYLALMFGSTIYAQTIVLAVFMGGLALGNRFIGARSDSLRYQLAAYGLLEVMIGFYGFWFDVIYRQGDRLFVALGAQVLEHPSLLYASKALISVGLLWLPTVLMGGTLPLLAAWLQKHSSDARRGSARFYSINSLGAVLGAWLAGFWLIRGLGLDSTLELTAIVNLLVGFGAIGLSRWERNELASVTGQAGPEESPPLAAQRAVATKPVAVAREPEPGLRFGHLCLVVALTGGISMGLEVLASRSLSLIFGASVQAFAVVLMSFILGIGLGGAAASSPRFKPEHHARAIGMLLLLAGLWLGVLVLGIEQWVNVYRELRTGLGRTLMGYRFYQILAAGFAMALLGLPAGLIGAVLPVCIRVGSRGGLGNSVGRLLTWNTLGAVVGVLLTGFILMPKAGLRNAFNVVSFALAGLALLMAWRTRKNGLATGAAGLILGLIVSATMGGAGWRYVLSAGAFRLQDKQLAAAIDLRRNHSKLLYYRDAADATVSVEQGDGVMLPDDIGLRISGKPDASSRLDMCTQLLLAHLPMLARPGATDVFVVGLGSGITSGGILAYPINHLVVGENCAPVLEAARFFAAWNRGVCTNRLARIWLEDARTILKLSPMQYDVIVSQPSNPWFATIGSVFSQEFFQTAANRLKPGGVMAQWFHVYEMADGIVDLVLRTFSTAFPVIEIWDAGGGDIILLGSDRPWDESVATLRKGYQREPVQRDLASIGVGTPEALLAHQLASQRTAFAIPGPGPVQSDAFPILEYDAPMAFFVGEMASRINRFDERTWQSALAPKEKIEALANLDDAALRGAFKYETINGELWRAIAGRLQASSNRAARPTGPGTGVPCVFVPPQTGFAYEIPGQAGEAFQRLMAARAALEQNNPAWREQVEIIRNALKAAPLPAVARPEEEPVARAAIAAAKVCLAHREYPLAKEMLELGYARDPNEAELGYLQRILERETGQSRDEVKGSK